ncbi:MAG: PspC domain-containing protein [Gammaproteobacteria bacterium]
MGKTRKTLHLDRENRKFLGVCAGVANFLEVEARTVRIVFFIGCIFGAWFLVPLYFIAWFLLDDTSASMRTSLTDNMMVNHFKNVDYHKKLYRNTREAKVFGVCAGIADYLEVNVFAVRMFVLVMLLMAVAVPILLYVGAALILDPKPDYLYDDTPSYASPRTRGSDQAQDVSGAASGANGRAQAHSARDELRGSNFSKRREFQFCVRKFAALHERLARMEAYVTSSRFKLHREFRNIS